MRVNSQLTKAQLENLSADPSQGTTGRVWLNTSSGKVKVDNGTLITSLGGGGGVSLRWWLDNTAPLENIATGIEVLDFNDTDSQQIFGMVIVPQEYAAGTQIKLSGGMFATTATTGTVLLNTTASLVEPGSSVLGITPNQHSSTNGAVTVSGVASTVTAIGDIDLTTAAGLINSVAVAAGDLIAITLIRDNAVDTAAADARFLRNSLEVVST